MRNRWQRHQWWLRSARLKVALKLTENCDCSEENQQRAKRSTSVVEEADNTESENRANCDGVTVNGERTTTVINEENTNTYPNLSVVKAKKMHEMS